MKTLNKAGFREKTATLGVKENFFKVRTCNHIQSHKTAARARMEALTLWWTSAGGAQLWSAGARARARAKYPRLARHEFTTHEHLKIEKAIVFSLTKIKYKISTWVRLNPHRTTWFTAPKWGKIFIFTYNWRWFFSRVKVCNALLMNFNIIK